MSNKTQHHVLAAKVDFYLFVQASKWREITKIFEVRKNHLNPIIQESDGFDNLKAYISNNT